MDLPPQAGTETLGPNYRKNGTRTQQRASEQFIAVSNTNPNPFASIKSAGAILDNVARFAAGTLRVHGQ